MISAKNLKLKYININ